jgi:hypothetical protein
MASGRPVETRALEFAVPNGRQVQGKPVSHWFWGACIYWDLTNTTVAGSSENGHDRII